MPDIRHGGHDNRGMRFLVTHNQGPGWSFTLKNIKLQNWGFGGTASGVININQGSAEGMKVNMINVEFEYMMAPQGAIVQSNMNNNELYMDNVFVHNSTVFENGNFQGLFHLRRIGKLTVKNSTFMSNERYSRSLANGNDQARNTGTIFRVLHTNHQENQDLTILFENNAFIDNLPVDIPRHAGFSTGDVTLEPTPTHIAQPLISFEHVGAEDKPFFLNMWFYNVHTPLQARQEKIDKYQQLVDPDAAQKNAVYTAMVEHTDEAVGRIIDQLHESGLADNTIIIFTSDNGGLIGNPNNPVTSNHPLRAGKGHAYEGGVRVPLIIAGPGIAEGDISSEPVISEDFFPTINTLANLKVDETISSSWCGSDLSPLLNHNQEIDRKSIYWHHPHYHRQGATPHSAVRMGDYKLIHFYEDGRDELYNLAEDIGESNDLSTTEPGVMDLLKHELERLLLDADAQMPSLNPNYDPSR